MINQDVIEFLNSIYTDWQIRLGDKMYFFNGWTENDAKSILHISVWDVNDTSGIIENDFCFESESMDLCRKQFLSAPIFEDGKTFWEIQDKMEVID